MISEKKIVSKMALKDNKEVKLITDFVNYFNDKNGPYVMIGGIAVNVWGRIRTTMDADFIFDDSKFELNTEITRRISPFVIKSVNKKEIISLKI